MRIKYILFVVGLTLMNGCESIQRVQGTEIVETEPHLEKISKNVWVHKSYKTIPPWGEILSQGMVVKSQQGVFLIDTAWTSTDTEKLLVEIYSTLGENPNTAIITHAHDDKMGGVDALHIAGIETWAHEYTNEDAPGRGLVQAKNVFSGSDPSLPFSKPFQTKPDQYESEIVVFFPGAGHTRDNIVVYHKESKTLFGGCLIRPGNASNLGNMADADVQNWAKAVRLVAARFPDAQTIIPSHGPHGGRKLLEHTIELSRLFEVNDHE